jgi:hypothetical protein
MRWLLLQGGGLDDHVGQDARIDLLDGRHELSARLAGHPFGAALRLVRDDLGRSLAPGASASPRSDSSRLASFGSQARLVEERSHHELPWAIPHETRPAS